MKELYIVCLDKRPTPVGTTAGLGQLEAATHTVDSPGIKSTQGDSSLNHKAMGTCLSGNLGRTKRPDTTERGTCSSLNPETAKGRGAGR